MDKKPFVRKDSLLGALELITERRKLADTMPARRPGFDLARRLVLAALEAPDPEAPGAAGVVPEGEGVGL